MFDFNNENEEKIFRGDRVQVTYAGIEGIVVDVFDNQILISYQDERDKEIVKEFMKEDVKKYK